MATEHRKGYRCDLILEPSQYSTVPPPTEEGKAKVSVKLQPEVFNPFILSPLPEQTIRDVLVDWVRNKPLLSPTAARGMVITGITHEVAYCYRLETFTEHRSVCLRFEPQCKTSKAPVSPKPAGEVQEPQPWKVPVTPAKMFHNQVLNYRLIHTDRVTGCSYCQEHKWVMCKACCASTRVRCPVCHGRGRGTKKPCRECKGEKMVPCMSCMSLGRVCCEMCVGNGQLCYFKELRVDYHCHLDRYLLGVPGGIPEERISHAIGEILHNGLGQKVCPISTFSVEEVNAASQRMVRSSHSSWPQCRIIQQRHLLRAVPVTRVQYRWRDTSGSVFIFGVDHSIYWPDYPERRIRLCCPWL
ncbi:protein SSUH2 homolog [Oncorhynchus clarkii lewisi]|uniref:protein SSUH2 homolog n=1 Tax=Oncorhynchus clarkii lewisi TaxID=490388 RepID=UPI0039B98E58